MTRIMNYISLVLLSLIFTTAKADVNLIEKTLRSQPLTVFDLGLLRLKNDLKQAKNDLVLEVDSKNVSTIYTEALFSRRYNGIQLIVSAPMSAHLNANSYMVDSIKCRKIFEKVKNNLLKGQNESNMIHSKAASYLSEVFTAPTQWNAWRYDKGFTQKLVNFVQLEVTLKPTQSYAVKNKVRPFSCGGSLASDYQQIEITRKFN